MAEFDPPSPAEEPEVKASASAADPVEPLPSSVPSAMHPGRYLRELASRAWGQQIRALVRKERYDEAVGLLDLAKVQWFAGDNLPRWRRSVYTAKAEALYARGLQAEHSKSKAEARRLFGEAREAATLAGDEELAERYDAHIEHLNGRLLPAEVLREIHGKLNGNQPSEAFQAAHDALQLYPGDSSLSALRGRARTWVLKQAEGALAASSWEKARELLAPVLHAFPDDGGARALDERGRRGLHEELVARARQAVASSKTKDARQFLKRALALDATSVVAWEVDREIRAVEKSNGQPAEEKYGEAYAAFHVAQAQLDAATAWDKALELKKLKPNARVTGEALLWAAGQRVESLFRELDEEPLEDRRGAMQPEVAEVLKHCPNFPPALKLLAELEVNPRERLKERRGQGLDALKEADEALRGFLPLGALVALEKVDEIGIPDQQELAERMRREALELCERQIRRKLRDPKNEGEVEEALDELARWDGERAGRLRDVWEAGRGAGGQKADANQRLTMIEKAVNGNGNRRAAHRLLLAELVKADREQSDLRRRKRAELIRLRQRLLNDMDSWWARWWARRAEAEVGLLNFFAGRES